jgi:hypothetical protein
MLAAGIDRLVAELLPAGKRVSGEWIAGSVAGEAGSSLSVNLRGKAGVWADFSTGEAGDALDLVAAVLYRGDKKQAFAWARTWLGLSSTAAPAIRRAYLPEPDRARAAQATEDDARRARAALRLYLEARPTLAGTPAESYLLARGIDLRALGRQPRALRFHPACRCTEVEANLPALIAAITDAEGRHVSTHRTWLAQHGGVWGKARLRDAKKTLGAPQGGTIRLWRGASGRALRDAPQGDVVGIGEGIETCLSVAQVMPELRVLSAVSLANMASVALPPTIGRVVLLADNDGAKPGAAAGLQRAIDHFTSFVADVRIARAPYGKDFNDCLRPR